ncbi:MAG TPA: ion transporter [Woeseiaceae bacterium]|nr:ion transporter [Woeseiaceae bacterium]
MKTIRVQEQHAERPASGPDAHGGKGGLRLALYDLLEGERAATPAGRFLNRALVALILANVAAVILESQFSPGLVTPAFFHGFEVASVVIFTLEYLGRLWAAPADPRYAGVRSWRARLAHAASPLAVVDLLAIAPFYLALLFPIDLRYLRAFRLLRLLKLSRYFDGLQVFLKVIRAEVGAISAALLTMFVLVIISACLMFSLESQAQPQVFGSVVDAIWWAVVTLTTVGYGDVTPVTAGGRILGMGIMLMGVATFALPAGILAARFSEELQERREKLRFEVAEALSDGVLDGTEQAELAELRTELGLSQDTLIRLVELHGRTAHGFRYCPRCGEHLDSARGG